MKRLLLSLVTFIVLMTLTGCGGVVSSTYHGVKVGDAAAKRLNAPVPAIKKAKVALDAYKKERTNGNLSKAKAAMKSADSEMRKNILTNNTEIFNTWADIAESNFDRYTSVNQMAGGLNTVVANFVYAALPKNFSKTYKIVRPYQKDVGVYTNHSAVDGK